MTSRGNRRGVDEPDNSSGNGGDDRWRAEEAIGGNREALEALRELITFPILYSREAQRLGLKWPRGLLLYGPPGTGKTSLVRAVVQECSAQLTIISPHSVHKAHAGESESILRESFSEASAIAMSGKPSVIFIDEVDVLCPHRNSRREQDVRLTSQLCTLMDSIQPLPGSLPQLVVVASTNRVDAIDPALRRYGRFDVEIEVTTPNEEERFQVLQALLLTMEDWDYARSIVGPSITRGVTVEIPKVSWDDIGGYKELKRKIQQAVEWPIKHSAAFSRLGISPIRGVLLHGPPGCSKTTLAKATAHATQASFFSLSGAELYSMYVGEGEALLRNTFRRARLAAPSIIFFDEADVVAGKRGGKSSSNAIVGERLLSTLLTEMDGLELANGIIVLAATNRPHAIDGALMRPGRFDLVLYVPPPDLVSRREILRVHTRNMKIGNDVDLRDLAEHTERFTGAELESLCREAGMVALRENIHATAVYDRHFQIVRESLKPALSEADIYSYESFRRTR
ncbi:cell division control protein 48 homolog B isoform X2 [Rhodamnia argentea]|uniref:Cell division control protein 48 homolog B isoform X2 n=1 Tax=Rhodamnia argentea TaxID=178133 RepID=A0ABM3HDU8_9MYRT|nr:cell division control protein 48 homolog B isoform X2 [Rhodamnia argentea]